MKYLIYFQRYRKNLVDKWLDKLKVDRDDLCLHFLFHLMNSEGLPETLTLINDVNCLFLFFCIK